MEKSYISYFLTSFCGGEIFRTLNTKEAMKQCISDYINSEFPNIKTYARIYKIRLDKDDKRKWLGYYSKDVNLNLL